MAIRFAAPAIMLIVGAVAAPLAAQVSAPATDLTPAVTRTAPHSPAQAQAGPRLQPEFPRYEASVPVRMDRASVATSAVAADRTTITISTVALVVLAVLLILLIAD